MYATELIGKNCVRERPANIGGSYGKDYSYCSTVVRIVDATDHNIILEYKICGRTRQGILDERWCDDAWVDYDAIVASGVGFSEGTKTTTERS